MTDKDEALSLEQTLRRALEALEREEYRLRQTGQSQVYSGIGFAITAIKAALEAKGEPVAWRDAAIRLGEELSSVGPNGYYDMDAKEWLDWAMEQNPRGEHSLPKRKPLTDAEVEKIIKANMILQMNLAGIRQDFEAAHGIKGEA